jgi:serine/threonine protein phosphatase PrpC
VVFDEDIHEINLEESEKIQNAFDKKENFEEYFKKSIDEITYLECGYLYNRKKEQILSMESAFGDFYLREYGFKPVPEIKVIDRNSLDNNLKYLLIASDGLWDIDNGNNNIFEVFENSFHINLVNRIVDENLNIARSLCSFARCQEGSPDDISAICITFN